mgnify:CR=1 FL=1
MERPALLEMQNITKEFPGVKALDGVSLTVRPGTVHALMGENGAGKSVMMKIINGTLMTDSLGQVSFETMMDTAAELGIETLEITTGGYSSAPHLDLDKLLSSADARREYLHAIESRGLKLETLNCNGNQLSPDETGARDAETVEKHDCDLNRSHEPAPLSGHTCV